MLYTPLLTLALALTPSLVSAGMFAPDSLVKLLPNAKAFKKAMKANETSMVAFFAPWCGHCQKMAPEYSKAALGLHPLVPLYAVNCDVEMNRAICSSQDIKGFPTVKLFPRGNTLPPMVYEGERTATGFYYWATRRIPQHFAKLYHEYEIQPWIEKNTEKHRALLLTKETKVPLLWKVLANKYAGQLEMGTHRDKEGKTSVSLGFEAGGKKESKVLIYPVGSNTPVRYEGITKLESLSKFFDSVLDGTADLKVAVEEAKKEEYVPPTDEELEIQRKQEAQRIALLHGGFTDLIDFEKAILEGGADYHDTAGYGGMMGGIPEHFKKKAEATAPEPASTAAPTTTSGFVEQDDVKPTPVSSEDADAKKAADVKKILEEAMKEAAEAKKTADAKKAEPIPVQEAAQVVLEEPASTPRPTDEL